MPGVTPSSTFNSAAVVVTAVPLIANFSDTILNVPSSFTLATSLPSLCWNIISFASTTGFKITSLDEFVILKISVSADLNWKSFPAASSVIFPLELSVTVVPANSAVPSAVILIFAAAALLSVVSILNVPLVPTVKTAVSSVEPVIVITLPSILISSTVKVVNVPRLVIFDCAAPVTVAAVPEQLPVKSPTKPVAVILPPIVTFPLVSNLKSLLSANAVAECILKTLLSESSIPII